MSPVVWTLASVFFLGTATMLLAREDGLADVETGKRRAWFQRWLLARSLVVVGAACVLAVWILE